MRIWNAIDGQLVAILQGHNADIVDAELSPDGQRIVTASSDKTARVSSTRDGQLLATLQGHSAEITKAEFSPDGERIVPVSLDNTGAIWNSSNGRLLAVAVLRGHKSGIIPSVITSKAANAAVVFGNGCSGGSFPSKA